VLSRLTVAQCIGSILGPMPRARLIDFTADTITALLRQPAQLRAFSQIVSFIEGLRQTSSDEDYFDLQWALFDEIFKAQKEMEEASRNVERIKKGRSVPPPRLASWAQDRALWERIQRQYRAVGDALVWRRLNFDRRYILAYSRNAGPGPITARLTGLRAEVEETRRIWSDHGQLALLHDLTNCLRIGDLTVFTDSGPVVRDVKRDPNRKPRPAQLRRMNQALDFLSGRGPLHSQEGSYGFFVSRQQFKTRFAALECGLAIAQTDSMASLYVSAGWVLDCFVAVVPRDRPAQSLQEALEEIEAKKARSYRRAGLDRPGTHRLDIHAAGELAYSPAVAPPTIFPLSPSMCARLTCDLAVYKSVMSWEALADAFRAEGFTVTNPLRPAFGETLDADDRMIVARYRHKGMDRHHSINAGGFAQVALELVEPRRYAAAMREAIEATDTRGPHRGVLTFANERSVWR
jgi:hypothetical protein